MLPLSNISNYSQIQVPLVNTAVPGSAVTHVPYDTVAPSVSNAQVDNNASPNNVQTTAPQPTAQQVAGNGANPSSASIGQQQSQNTGLQTAFLTQLLAQDNSPETQTILVQYEKLVALGNVKYKPSNAFKPEEPSSLFGQILHQEQSAPVEAAPVEVHAEPVETVQPQPVAYTPPDISPHAVDAYSASAARNAQAASVPATELA